MDLPSYRELVRRLHQINALLLHYLEAAKEGETQLHPLSREMAVMMTSIIAAQASGLLVNMSKLSVEEKRTVFETVVYLKPANFFLVIQSLEVEPELIDVHLKALCACTAHPENIKLLQAAITAAHPEVHFNELEMISPIYSKIKGDYDAALVRCRLK